MSVSVVSEASSSSGPSIVRTINEVSKGVGFNETSCFSSQAFKTHGSSHSDSVVCTIIDLPAHIKREDEKA